MCCVNRRHQNIQKRSWKSEQKIENQVSCFFWVLSVKSIKTNWNSLVKIGLSSDILVFLCPCEKYIWCLFVILHVSKLAWSWSNSIFCLIFLFFAEASKKWPKFYFFFFFELAHKELKLYQILVHYHFSIKRYRLGSLAV